jgi:hypothetical protein
MKMGMYSSLVDIRLRLRLPGIGEYRVICRDGLERRDSAKGLMSWIRDTIPSANRLDLKDVVLALTGHAIEGRRNRVVLRKLFVAVSPFPPLYFLLSSTY